MKNLLLILFSFLFCAFAKGQDMPEPPPNVILTFGLHEENGKLISPDDKQISITFYYDDFTDSKKEKVFYFQNQVKFSDSMYVLTAWRDEEAIITITKENKEMIIHTCASIDSITFTEGEYKIDKSNSFLFQTNKYDFSKIMKPDMNNFKINSTFKIPYCGWSQDLYWRDNNPQYCKSYAQKIEQSHGGKNWAANACNNNYQPVYICADSKIQERINVIELTPDVNKLRIQVYPLLKTKFIKHEFCLEDQNFHTFSVSNDSCKTWTKLCSVKNEWHIQLVYFPDIEKIGIDCIDFLLVADYSLQNWNYYVVRDSNHEGGGKKTVGLALKNANWYDDGFSYYEF